MFNSFFRDVLNHRNIFGYNDIYLIYVIFNINFNNKEIISIDYFNLIYLPN